MHGAAEGRLRECTLARTQARTHIDTHAHSQRESESVLAFLVKGQPDTDVIRDRWA